MIDKAATLVLGAQDPEMREIERVARDARMATVAAAWRGRRCDARSAYGADGVVQVGPDKVPRAAVLRPGEPFIEVECTLRGRQPAGRVDHHRPGDPGFDAPPEDYLRGSSLGQLLARLERDATPTQRLLAAGDHCLTAAYAGQCPGVSPHDLLFLRASWKALVTGRTLTDVVEGILDAAGRVRRHVDSESGEARFLDPTEVPPDLAEGAAYTGVPIRYRELRPDGTLKEMFKGGSPAAVEAFLAGHRAQGRVVYGNPWRGYGGTYYADGP